MPAHWSTAVPMNGVLYLRLDAPLPEAALADLRGRFVAEAGLDPEDDLYAGGTLVHEDDPFFLPDPAAHWYDARLARAYYGPGYERGHLPLFVRCAEWLEAAVPGGRVWYGNDGSDDSIRPFDPAARDELLAYYARHGHEPYDRRAEEWKRRPAPPRRKGLLDRLMDWITRAGRQ